MSGKKIKLGKSRLAQAVPGSIPKLAILAT
jgi:hypothetical protein